MDFQGIAKKAREVSTNFLRWEFDKTSLLSEAGISHPERYEAIASLPDEVFKSISKMSSRVTKNSQQQEY